jgi:hypothetical protein
MRRVDETDIQAVGNRIMELRFMYAQLLDLDPKGAENVDVESRRLISVHGELVALQEVKS